MQDYALRGKSADEINRGVTEERRGVFVLGLIAILVVVRYQMGSSFMIPIGQTWVDAVPLVNTILFSWALYAFSMIVALSVGGRIQSAAEQLAQAFLYVGLIVVVGIALWALVYGFSPSSYYLAAILVAYSIAESVIYIQKIRMGRVSPPQIRSQITKRSAAKFVLFLSVTLLLLSSVGELLDLYQAAALTVLAILCLAYLEYRRFKNNTTSAEKSERKGT